MATHNHSVRIDTHRAMLVDERPNGISQQRLKALVSYDPNTGLFANREQRHSLAADAPLGTPLKSGYVQICVDNFRYKAHRLAWLYMTGEMPKVIDHKNGNPADNRFANLRAVTQRINTQNVRAARRDNVCGLMGVTKRTRGRVTYEVRIWIDGKRKHIGCFASATEAHEAYLSAKRQHHAGCTL